MTRGRGPSLEIEDTTRTKRGERTHKAEAIIEHTQEIGPDFPGMIGHNPEIEAIQETTEEGVFQRVKIRETIETIEVGQETEAKKYLRNVSPADVRIA